MTTTRKFDYHPDWERAETASLWDSINYKDGEQLPNSIDLFQNSIGQFDRSGDVRRLVDTSMVRGGQLPPPHYFKINRVLFTFSASTSDKMVYSFAEATVWTLRINDRLYLRNALIALPQSREPTAPIRTCQFCRAVWVMSETCPGCGAREFTLSTIGQSEERVGRQFFLDLPADRTLLIEPLQSFALNLMTHGLFVVDGTLRMWVHFEGAGLNF
jgi:hypothetical protein